MTDYSHYNTFAAEPDPEQLRRLERECLSLKNYDPVTGLPHLPLFLCQAERAAVECSRRERPLGAIALSFDSIHATGALYGLDGGNLLRAIVRQLRSCLRAEHFFARVGNKFLVLLPSLDAARTAALARRFVDGGMELEVDGMRTIVAACAGAATIESWSDDVKRDVRAIMDQALAALHASWRRGAGLATTHTPELGRRLRRQGAIELELPHAARRQQLYVLYQPIVAPHTQQIVAVEALTRWQHPELGIVSPAEFIPIVERASMSAEFDQWVFEHALEDFKAMRRVANLDLHVNVCPTSLEAVDAVETRLEAIDEAGVPRSAVTLELTETVQAERFDVMEANVQRLRAAGVRVAIDDLGCGYNSLQFFARMPVDLVKIDRSLLARGDGNEIFVLLAGVLETCGRLGIEAVFEGIETEEQHRLAIECAVQYAQGYHYAVPLPAAHVLPLLAKPGCDSRAVSNTPA
ncbi:MAG TPA: GGDEF domain-containing protein [Verrucomicrobiae bacterium]|nr:GGDEF domain-containing protein [Verrucomicrobiae bacterium]